MASSTRSKTPFKAAPRLRKIARAIVEQFDPEQIILFGSHARNQAHEHSDIDLLVVMNLEGSRREKALEIGMAVHPIASSTDVIVVTPDEFAWRKDVVGTIEYPAAREGRSLYERR